MRMKLAALGAALLLTGCLDTTTKPVGEYIDCTTPALAYKSGDVGFTTTSSGLVYRDVTVGTGATFASGNSVSVRYGGCLTNGTKFDSNESPGPVLSFKLGGGGVIAGFDEGLMGMKVGGRRELVIPPNLAYGNKVNGPIPANSTLVFIIDAASTP